LTKNTPLLYNFYQNKKEKENGKMLIEARLILTKLFPRGVSKITFGRYEIHPLSLYSSTEVETMLSFKHTLVCPEGKCHPEEEIDIICKLLSVFFNTKIRRTETKADENDIPIYDGRERSQYPQFFGYLQPESTDDLIHRVLSLDENTARQFIRACRCYSYALELIPSDPHFAFFFLVTSGEFMSSQDKTIPFSELNPLEKRVERFCNFIIKYLPEEFKGEDNNLITELLHNAHDYYSADFIIGGKGIFSAALDADKTGAIYSSHIIEDKEIKLPGFTWLSKFIRGALIGYLKSLPAPSKESVNEELFSLLTLEKAKLK